MTGALASPQRGDDYFCKRRRRLTHNLAAAAVDIVIRRALPAL